MSGRSVSKKQKTKKKNQEKNRKIEVKIKMLQKNIKTEKAKEGGERGHSSYSIFQFHIHEHI